MKKISIIFFLLALSSCSLYQQKENGEKKEIQNQKDIVGSCITDDISLPGKKMCIESSRDEKDNCIGEWSNKTCDTKGFGKKCYQMTNIENGLTKEKYILYTNTYTLYDSKMQCAGEESSIAQI